MDKKSLNVPLSTISTAPWNGHATPDVTVKLLDDGEMRVVDGYHRLLTQLELSGGANVLEVNSGETLRIVKSGDKLLVTKLAAVD